MKITEVVSVLLDIPLPRMQKRAFGTFDKVNHLIVRLRTDEGLEGLGEAAACGGLTWSINRYLAPVLKGQLYIRRRPVWSSSSRPDGLRCCLLSGLGRG